MSNLALKFPLFQPGMTLVEEVRVVNDMRLGMFTKNMEVSEVNKHLDELLPTLTEDEICSLLQNLSMGYAKCKIWAEKQRKTRIKLDVNEDELRKQLKANDKRSQKKTSGKPAGEKIQKVASVEYDSNAAINKAIKEMIKVTGSYASAVGTLKAIGGLPADYKLIEGA